MMAAIHILTVNYLASFTAFCKLEIILLLCQDLNDNEEDAIVTRFRVWHWSTSDGEAPVLDLGRVWSQIFITITPRSTLTWNDNTRKSSIFGSNRSVWKLFVLDNNTWNGITVQKSDYYHKKGVVTCNNITMYHHHHHVVSLARISLTLSRHFSLSFIASGWSSGLHSVSSHSCCMYVHPGCPAFTQPYMGIHKSTSLMSSSLLLQQCPACLVRLTWIVFVKGSRWPIVGVLWGVAARTCSRLLAAFLCNSCLASSSVVL